MPERYVSVPMTLIDLERLDGSLEGSNFQTDLLNNARTVRARTTKFDRITHIGEYCVFSHTPYRKGAVPQRTPIFGNLFCLCVNTSSQKYQT